MSTWADMLSADCSTASVAFNPTYQDQRETSPLDGIVGDDGNQSRLCFRRPNQRRAVYPGEVVGLC